MEQINKHDCLARVKALLDAGDTASLRYACLELRSCMEEVTYEKLRAYAPRLPRAVLDDCFKWQPPQLVKVLLGFEEDADQEYTVAIKRTGSTEPFQVMGEHRSFAIKWLRKHYSKIGGYLHAPRDIDLERRPRQIEPQELRQYLEIVIKECEHVVESSIKSTLAPTVEFFCQLCHKKTMINAESAKKRTYVSCWNPECEARYIISTGEDGSPLFHPSVVYPCLSCNRHLFLADKLLDMGYEFTCDVCGHRHKLVEQVWRYTDEIEGSAKTS